MGGACTTEVCSTGLAAEPSRRSGYDLDKPDSSARRSSSMEQDVRAEAEDFEDEMQMQWVIQCRFPESSNPSDTDESPLTNRSGVGDLLGSPPPKLSAPSHSGIAAGVTASATERDLSQAELSIQFRTLTLLSRSRVINGEERSHSARPYAGDTVPPPLADSSPSSSMFIESCYIVESEALPLLSPHPSATVDRECSEERSSQAVDPDTFEFDEMRKVKLRMRREHHPSSASSPSTTVSSVTSSQVAGYLALEVKRETDLLHNISVCVGYIPLSFCIDNFLTRGGSKRTSVSSPGDSTSSTRRRRSSARDGKVRYKRGEFIVKMYAVPSDLSNSPKAPEQLELTEQKSSTPIESGETWFDHSMGFPRRPTVSIFESPDYLSHLPRPGRDSLVKLDRDGIARLLKRRRPSAAATTTTTKSKSESDGHNLAAVLICSAQLEWPPPPSPLSLSPLDVPSASKKGSSRMPTFGGPEKPIALLVRDRPSVLKLALFGLVFTPRMDDDAGSPASSIIVGRQKDPVLESMSKLNENELQKYLQRMIKKPIHTSSTTTTTTAMTVERGHSDDEEGTPPPASLSPSDERIEGWSLKVDYKFGGTKETRRTSKKYHSENRQYLWFGKVFEIPVEKHSLSLFTESCDTSPDSCVSSSTMTSQTSDRNAELLFDEESSHIGKSGAILIRVRNRKGQTVACSALSVRDLLNRSKLVRKKHSEDGIIEEIALDTAVKKKHRIKTKDDARRKRRLRKQHSKSIAKDLSELAVCKLDSIPMFEYTRYEPEKSLSKLPVIMDDLRTKASSMMSLRQSSTMALMDGMDCTNPLVMSESESAGVSPAFTPASLLDRMPSKGRLFYKCVFVWP